MAKRKFKPLADMGEEERQELLKVLHERFVRQHAKEHGVRWPPRRKPEEREEPWPVILR